MFASDSRHFCELGILSFVLAGQTAIECHDRSGDGQGALKLTILAEEALALAKYRLTFGMVSIRIIFFKIYELSTDLCALIQCCMR